MPLVTTDEMLKTAQAQGYAIGAFNAENMEMAQAIVAAAEEVGYPLIIQVTSSTLKYTGVECFAGMVGELARNSKAQIAMHLDHGNGFALASRCVRHGFSSIMIDGSALDFEGNVALSRSVVDMCAPNGIPVEAELGAVGGKEDETEGQNKYTDPAQAAEFVARTGISSLAVAIGTSHGFYKGTPVLDVERLKDIRKVVDVPLVLHGSSGLSDEQVISCVREGICKVNFATELRAAYTAAVREVLQAKPNAYDPKEFGKVAREKVKEQVIYRMKVCLAGH